MTAVPANTTMQQARTRHRKPLLAVFFSVLGVVAAWTRVHAPTVAKRASRAVLTVTGYGFVCAAAWTLALPLGLLAIGLALLVIEWQVNGE